MPGSRISTTVTDTVLLGGDLYPSPLTIAASGAVAPAAYSAVGVLADASGVRLVNKGHVTGGAGTDNGSVGGIGVDLRSGSDTLSNAGTIAGGHGSFVLAAGYRPGNGGDGVDIAFGTVTNAGMIIGGAGGNYAAADRDPIETGGSGGAGVFLDASSLSNGGTIVGGAGGLGGDYGGDGVILGAGDSFLRNNGLITGGGGTDASFTLGGNGVRMQAGDRLVNAGTILGGAAASGGIGLILGAGNAVNLGTIDGGNATSLYGNGGLGVLIDGGTLTNFGTISGGIPGPGGYPGYGDYSGFGIYFRSQGGTLVMEPGAVAGTAIANDPSKDVLRFAGTGGTLDNENLSYFTVFADVIVNAGASWDFTGEKILGVGSSFHLLGALTISSTGALTDYPGSSPDLTPATVFIGPNGTLSVLGTLAIERIRFAAGGGTLSLGASALLKNEFSGVTSTLTGFTSGDVIDVAKIATSLSFGGGKLTLSDGSTVVETIHLAGDYTSANFHLSADQHGGTDVTYIPSASTRGAPSASMRGAPSASMRGAQASAASHDQHESSVGMMSWFHGHAG